MGKKPGFGNPTGAGTGLPGIDDSEPPSRRI